MKVGFSAYANPTNFLHIAAKLLPWLEATVKEGMITMEYVTILLYRRGA